MWRRLRKCKIKDEKLKMGWCREATSYLLLATKKDPVVFTLSGSRLADIYLLYLRFFEGTGVLWVESQTKWKQVLPGKIDDDRVCAHAIVAANSRDREAGTSRVGL